MDNANGRNNQLKAENMEDEDLFQQKYHNLFVLLREIVLKRPTHEQRDYVRAILHKFAKGQFVIKDKRCAANQAWLIDQLEIFCSSLPVK
jgi:hypothetical protein